MPGYKGYLSLVFGIGVAKILAIIFTFGAFVWGIYRAIGWFRLFRIKVT